MISEIFAPRKRNVEIKILTGTLVLVQLMAPSIMVSMVVPIIERQKGCGSHFELPNGQSLSEEKRGVRGEARGT